MIKASDIYLFDWGELWYEEFEIEAAIDALRRLVNSQEISLEEVRAKFKKKLKSDPTYSSLAPEDRGDYYSQFFQSEEQTINEIKRLQRNSVLMAIFAFFEGRLKSICQKIEDENTLPVKLSDVKGRNDIQKLWNFLVTVYKIDATKVEPHLKLIDQQKFARNRVIHHEGHLSKDQKKRLLLVAGLEVKDYINDSQIDITNVVFLENLLSQIEAFFKELLLTIDKRHKEIKSLSSR